MVSMFMVFVFFLVSFFSFEMIITIKYRVDGIKIKIKKAQFFLFLKLLFVYICVKKCDENVLLIVYTKKCFNVVSMFEQTFNSLV